MDNKNWLSWLKELEEITKINSLDGDQSFDGYSLDGCYESFLNGSTPVEQAEHIAECIEEIYAPIKALAEAQKYTAVINIGTNGNEPGCYLIDKEAGLCKRYDPRKNKAQAFELLEWMRKQEWGVSIFNISVCLDKEIGYFHEIPINDNNIAEAITNAAWEVLCETRRED